MLPTSQYFVAASQFNHRIATIHLRKSEYKLKRLRPALYPRQFFSSLATMAPKELNFITGNKNKLAEVQAILSVTPVKLQSQAVDLLEIQGTIEEVSKDKCRRAAEAVCIST
jgi:hypothetical protein